MGLFGSVKKAFGGSSSESKAVRKPLWNKEQQQIFQNLYKGFDWNLSSPAPAAPRMYVPRTPEEGSYFSFVQGLGRNQGLQKLLKGEPAYQVNPEATRRFFEEGIRPAAVREWSRTVLPQIQEAYAGPGFYGSSRARAVTRSVEDLGSKLNETYANLLYQDEQARREALDRAMARVPEGVRTYAEQAGSAGQLARSIEQERVAADLQRFLMGQQVEGSGFSPYYHPAVNLALNLLGLRPYTYAIEGTERGPGLGYSLLSGMGRGLGTVIANS